MDLINFTFVVNLGLLLSLGIVQIRHMVEGGLSIDRKWVADSVSRFMNMLEWTRLSEWWEYKLVPAIAVAYAACLVTGSTIWDVLPSVAVMLPALIAGGIYVSVLNDLTDRRDDALGGKDNPQAGARILVPVAILAVAVVIGGGFAWHWRNDPLLVGVYAAGWIAYTLYSVPPVRLKTRGAGGLLCDAIGANVVPALMAALVCARATQVTLPSGFLVAVAIWALAFGLRGILWHQIGDLAADRLSVTKTFIVRWGKAVGARLARYFIFPLEIASLFTLIAYTGLLSGSICFLALAAYAFLIHERIERFEMTAILVVPSPRSSIILHEYYDVFLPLALLLAAVAIEPLNLFVLLLHAIIFPVRWRQVAGDFNKLRDPQYARRHAWRRPY